MVGGERFDMWVLGLVGLFMLALTACQPATPISAIAGEPIPVSPTWTSVPTQAPSHTPEATPRQLPVQEATSTPVMEPALATNPTATQIFYEPAGCWQPPDDYTRININGYTLNTRTYAMLQQAAQFYGGEIDVAGKAIIRGSYEDDPTQSDQTHQGGGAIDISVIRPDTSFVLYGEIEPLIRALRTVGFAAWLREEDSLEPGLGKHIHAIAIGDHDLSPAAQEQLTGPTGYMRGMDGLPATTGEPGQDRHGGPLICHWMLAAGYTDLRTSTSTPSIPWQERLRQAALAYQAFYPEDADKVARSLNFLGGKTESAENICGPLSAAILRDAGLLPTQAGPVQDLLSYWQARPSTNGRPWSLFPERDYEVFRFDTPLAQFDFVKWPLQPADFVYTYAKDGGYEHMFIVTEVDAEGRAYTVTNQPQPWGNDLWGSMLILRYMLYDPQSPGKGIIYEQWSDPHIGRTGFGGFEVLRKRGLEAGSLYEYTVRLGDTLPDLSARFGATSQSIIQANPGLDLANLQIDQRIIIPIPSYTPAQGENLQGGLP